MITYRVSVYDSQNLFNETADTITRDGWTVKDFRVVDSAYPNTHGLLVLWQRSDSPELKEHL